MNTDDAQSITPWSRRFALLLCWLTFPLICVGGLITTTDAGMAVPDWPGTYGSNLFLYPWSTWFFGPWDLFVEHGHRLFGSLVGLVAIGFLATVLRSGSLRLRRLAWVALALVIFQGVLGGMRVVLNERLLAMAHGVTGPLFFALTCVIVGRLRETRPAAFGYLAVVTATATFAQLALGAGLRHMPETAGPWAFATIVKLHLVGAATVALLAIGLAARALFSRSAGPAVRLAGAAIGLVVLLQLSAGVGTWLLKYGAPGWADGWAPATVEATIANGWWQKTIVTAHQAGGSLLLGLGAFVATRTLGPRVAASQEDAGEDNAPSPTEPERAHA